MELYGYSEQPESILLTFKPVNTDIKAISLKKLSIHNINIADTNYITFKNRYL